MSRLVTVVSDFTDDYYHGVMKGVIAKGKGVNFIDLPIRHPQSIINTAWILQNSYNYFPTGTIFLIVVDPGVGTSRKAIVVTTKDYTFVLPDNGIISPISDKIIAKYEIDIHNSASTTFHGRDVFAPAVIDVIENKWGKFTELEKVVIDKELSGLKENNGKIVDIDSFGNIITNLKPRGDVEQIELEINNTKLILSKVTTFEDLSNRQFGIITGSCNSIEIVGNKISATKQFDVSIGENVKIID